eukprot:136838_1
MNSENQLILIGGCSSFAIRTDHGCYSGSWSTDIYLWNIDSTPLYTKIGSIPSNISFLFNPSHGYPYPIENDILYIPYYNAIFKYHTTQNEWMFDENITIPIPVYWSCNVYDRINHKLYILGGIDYPIVYYGSVQIYDLYSKTWTAYDEVTYMPHGIYGGSCVLKNGFIYYFGGKVAGTHTDSIMKYSIEGDIWTTLPSNLSSSYFGSKAIVLNNTNIFVIGGAGYKYDSSSVDYHLYYSYNTIHNFDILTESISVVANMNLKRYSPQIALVNRHIYIAGGVDITNWNTGTVLVDSIMSLETWTDEYVQKYPSNITTSTTAATGLSMVYELCIYRYELFDGIADLSLSYDMLNKKMQIKIESPNTQWFAVGFGGNRMDGTYAITVSDDFVVEERRLGDHIGGSVLVTNSEILKEEYLGEREVLITRDWSDVGYNFTDWFQCNIASMDIVWAVGYDLHFGHHQTKGSDSLPCGCTTIDTTDSNSSYAAPILLIWSYFVICFACNAL